MPFTDMLQWLHLRFRGPRVLQALRAGHAFLRDSMAWAVSDSLNIGALGVQQAILQNAHGSLRALK